ncbi:MAG TPA: six-hairpin glycosidase, partial [Bacteroidales bacterium]|nr:six-hairpin glycosidase [Bacteroidales bacterium]
LECDSIRTFNKGTTGRAEWFGTACCPPNISRLILQTPGYIYSYTSDEIYLTLYASSEAEIPLENGTVNIKQTSDYPYTLLFME